MFDADPRANADLKAGVLYALIGEEGWLYYGQVTGDKAIAFFRCRSGKLEDPAVVVSRPVMSVISVAYPSITRAMRAGKWAKLGRLPLADGLSEPRLSVQWPVKSTTVTVWRGGEAAFDTRVDDPAIQQAELMAVWDAQHHIPARLTADFSPTDAAWHVGGPIWRERRVKEEMARRYADAPQHALPADWVHTDDR